MTSLNDLKKIAESTVNRICQSMHYPQTAVYVSMDQTTNKTRATLLDFANGKDRCVEHNGYVDVAEWAKAVADALRELHTDSEADAREGLINFTVKGKRYAISIHHNWFHVFGFVDGKPDEGGEYHISLAHIIDLLSGNTKITDVSGSDLKETK